MAKKFTDPKTQIEFTNYIEPGADTGGFVLGRVANWEDRDNNTPSKNCVINALDIWWDGAKLGEQTIETTGDLLKTIKDISDNSIYDISIDSNGILKVKKGNGAVSSPGNIGNSQLDKSDLLNLLKTILEPGDGIDIVESNGKLIIQLKKESDMKEYYYFMGVDIEEKIVDGTNGVPQSDIATQLPIFPGVKTFTEENRPKTVQEYIDLWPVGTKFCDVLKKDLSVYCIGPKDVLINSKTINASGLSFKVSGIGSIIMATGWDETFMIGDVEYILCLSSDVMPVEGLYRKS